MKAEVTGINQRSKRAHIGVKDILSVVDMTLEDQFREMTSPFPYEIFEGLNELIDRTVHGTRIECFRPKEGRQPFNVFEIHTERGEALGYLNMIYLSKPIPCYYLVYVEVLSPFRGRGLGNKILKTFKEFAEDKGAVGLLDNIIPPYEPTYDIYMKLGWRSIEELIGKTTVNGEGNYMVFIPTSMKTLDLREKLIKLLFKIKKKRPLIEMHDNESMVKRTISEFRSVYEVLEHLFERELSTGASTPFMCFMFTKFVTRTLGFRRRIATLLGYTGGESLGQITLSEQIKSLPIQPYSLWNSKGSQVEIRGEEKIIRILPEDLKKEPTLYIESLPLYRRPYLLSRVDEKGEPSLQLKISDLLELEFDPTRLREFQQDGVKYIIERISLHLLPSIERKKKFFPRIIECLSETRFCSATLQINPPLVILQDRGNVYILRRKVEGIHSDEALDQLRTSPHLKEMNREVGIDRVVVMTIHEIRKCLRKVLPSNLHEEIEDLTFFVPWDFERNIPRITVNMTDVSLGTLWVA